MPLGFVGLTPLQEAVLIGCSDDVNNELSKYPAQVDENLLHQSALHLTVWRPHHLKLLLNGKLNVDSRDWNGRTPLMYAATAGMTEVAISLVEAGADLWAQDDLYGSYDFIHYAVRSTHWDLVIEVLDFVRGSPMFSSEQVQSLLNTAIVLWAGETVSRRSEHLHALLVRGADPEVRFTDRWQWHREQSNTLLHSISTLSDFDSLVANGFNSLNHENSSGAHPLMKLVERNNPQLLRKCLESGSRANHQDHSGRTALRVNAEEIRESYFSQISNGWDLRFESFQCAEVLLRHGSDPFLGDKCRCACSTMGCTPGQILLKEYHKLWKLGFLVLPRCQYFLSLEWLNLILEVNGLEAAKHCLLDMIRLVRFEELGLTHTCCRNPSSKWKAVWTTLDEDEVDEILDEEKEMVMDLESQMCEIEKDVHAWSDPDTLFFPEVIKLIPIRDERQRSLFLESEYQFGATVGPHRAQAGLTLTDLPYTSRPLFWKSSRVFKSSSHSR
jgi:ankyrin repeat protein